MEPDGQRHPSPTQITEGDIGPFSAVKVPVIFSPVIPGAVQTRFKVTFNNQECPTVSVPQTLRTHGHCRADPSWAQGPPLALPPHTATGPLPEPPTLVLLVDGTDGRPPTRAHVHAHTLHKDTHVHAHTHNTHAHVHIHMHAHPCAHVRTRMCMHSQTSLAISGLVTKGKAESINAVCANEDGAVDVARPSLSLPLGSFSSWLRF